MRREFFDAYLFDSLAEVKMMTEEWVYDYNNYRPHSTLGKLSPICKCEFPLVTNIWISTI
jgi:putative transposase